MAKTVIKCSYDHTGNAQNERIIKIILNNSTSSPIID
jgi:hypothetical protein